MKIEQIYNPADYCSTDEAAQLLGVSLRTVRLWVESGVIQAWRTPGGHRRIIRSSLQKLLTERENAKEGIVEKNDLHEPYLLFVDDDENMRFLYETQFSGMASLIKIQTAQDGFEALLKIGEQKPAALVTDLNMPGMDGFRMIRSLRANKQYRTMPIIIVSGMDAVSIQAVGVPEDVLVLKKPAPFQQLKDAISGVIQIPKPS